MTLTHKQYREALEHILTNILELKSESPIWKALIHNGCDCIKYLVSTPDINIPNFSYKTSTKALESVSIWHHNIIKIFISYFLYQNHGNDPFGYY